MILYNPIDKFYKSKTGSIRQYDEVEFRIKGNFSFVNMLIRTDGCLEYEIRPLKKMDGFFELKTSFDFVGLYFYFFETDCGYIYLNNDYLGEISCAKNEFQLSVYSSEYNVPSWLKGGVIYQIFPDRFYSFVKNKKIDDSKILHDNFDDLPFYRPVNGKVYNNDFYGGDFLGIKYKIPFLKELGVSVIYLNPIFKAYSNHRYDTADYMEFDPLLGTKEDFISLIEEAKKNNIKIILDGVFNHTGDDSIYFNKYNKYKSIGAFQDKNSPYYSWFNFEDFPLKYSSWWGINTLPSTNKNSKSFIDFITGDNGVLSCYTKMGIGGWRLDVVDELPEHFSEKIRSAVKKINSDAVVIGEVWEDASNKISYDKRRKYFLGKELDSVMNYPLKDAIISFVLNQNSDFLSYVIKTQIDHYPKFVLDSLMNILSTHDTYRIISVLSGKNFNGLSKDELYSFKLSDNEYEIAKKRVKIASLLEFSLFGVPCVYYGDEAGVQGTFDPTNRSFYPWGKEDEDLVAWYKFLGKLRRDFSALADGEFVELFLSKGVYVYCRKKINCEVLFAVNSGENEALIEFDGKLLELTSNKTFNKSYVLDKLSVAVFIKNS